MIVGKAPHTNYVFVAPNAGRSLLRLGLLTSLVGLCVGGTLAVSQRQLRSNWGRVSRRSSWW